MAPHRPNAESPRGPTTAAIVLTGGASSRMGRHKPALTVGGRPIIVRVLEATAGHRTVVVGGAEAVPAGITIVREHPEGGGPVAGIAAGLAALDQADVGPATGLELVAVLAGDLPFLTGAALAELFVALDSGPIDVPRPDVAIAVDGSGRSNWLCGVWRVSVLRQRLADLGDPTGLSVRRLVAGLPLVHVLDEAGWSRDVDTPDDLEAARRADPR